ncbi:MAG: hypothetical protein KGQ59_08755, partial [Bdellovibrionales bacterium]|nr:hypothetical protein [Bdellovibrionales bacterium]
MIVTGEPTFEQNSSAPLLRGGPNTFARARLFATASLAALSFSVASLGAIQVWSSWLAWSSASPVRVSLGMFQGLSKLHFKLEDVSRSQIAATAHSDDEPLRAPAQSRKPRPHRAAVNAPAQRVTQAPLTTTHDLLRSIATINSERLLRLWSLDSPSVQVVARASSKPVSHQRPTRRRSNAVVAQSPARVDQDRLTIHSSAPAAPQRHFIPERPPLTTQSQAVEAVPRLKTQLFERVATIHLSSQKKEQPLRQPAREPEPIADRKEPGRLSRLTRESNGEAWILSSMPGAPTVVMAQTNRIIPRWFNPSELNSQSRVATQEGFGWISGWISSGTGARVRGSKEVLYFDASGERIGADGPGDKFFVSTGVPAGSSVVQVVALADETVVTAVGAPVLSGHSTQIDFRGLQKVRVRGSLWDSAAESPQGVARAELKLVGFPNHLVISGSDGSFDLGEVQLPV